MTEQHTHVPLSKLPAERPRITRMPVRHQRLNGTRWIPRRVTFIILPLCLFLFMRTGAAAPAKPDAPLLQAGVARVDITPQTPIRLSGYGNRSEESTQVEQPIWAKALAISDGTNPPIVLITVDNCGVPATVTREVVRRLQQRWGISESQLAICSSHTHAAPMLTGVLPLLFGEPIPTDQQQRIDAYTRRLIDQLEHIAESALKDLRPSRVEWTVGEVDFAINRRAQKVGLTGPVDHSLQTLRVVSPSGELRAVLVRYTCHAVALFGDNNRVLGDWPGYAQAAIERDHPGCTALVTIGCAGDQKPNLQSRLEHARLHGESITHEVNRLLATDGFEQLAGPLQTRIEHVELPFLPLPTLDEWQRRAAGTGQAAYHASVQLQRLQQGRSLPTELPYVTQAWSFGDDLLMINLAGEVVVDYSVRLGREFDRQRLWVNAYANDVPCYIPSNRVLAEGGYEPDRSMLYYDRPASFAQGIEQIIMDAIHRTAPSRFRTAEN